MKEKKFGHQNNQAMITGAGNLVEAAARKTEAGHHKGAMTTGVATREMEAGHHKGAITTGAGNLVGVATMETEAGHHKGAVTTAVLRMVKMKAKDGNLMGVATREMEAGHLEESVVTGAGTPLVVVREIIAGCPIRVDNLMKEKILDGEDRK